MTGSPVRFGLIGFGAWGQCHAEAITHANEAQLVAIAAHSHKSCEAARAAYPEADVHSDYRDLVKCDDIDVAVVVVPSHLHREISTDVLAANKHLLLEKPMCLSVGDCDALIQLARERKRHLAVGHELRLSSLWSKAKELVDDGFLGEPQYVLVELSRKPYRLGADGWRYDIQRVGSWILEEPIHFFDLARWYLEVRGEPQSVFAIANSRQPDHPELHDNFSSIVSFPGGAYAVVSQTLSAFEHHQTVKVAGTKGALWAGWSGAMDRTRHPTFFLKASNGDNVQELPISKVTGEIFELEDQVAMMARAVRDGSAPACTGEDGKRSVAMCLAAERSLETGAPVAI